MSEVDDKDGEYPTLRLRSGTILAYNFVALELSPSSPPSTSLSQASPHSFGSKPSLRTPILPQLSHPAGMTILSRSSAFGLCRKGNGLRGGAVASLPAIAGEGAGGMNNVCNAYCLRTCSAAGCGVV